MERACDQGRLVRLGNRGEAIVDNKKGFTLYFVLIILSIFSLLFSVVFLGMNYATHSTIVENHKSQARLLALSGITRAEFFLNGGDNHDMSWETPLFEEPVKDYGLIQISVTRFGAFSKIVSTGKRIAAQYAITAIFGRNPLQVLEPSLTLTGHVGGLVLQEGSNIQGTIVLHHGDISEKSNGKPLAEYQKRLVTRQSPSLPFDSLYIVKLFDALASRDSLILGSATNTPSKENEKKINGTDSAQSSDTMIFKGEWNARACSFTNKTIIVTGALIGSDAAAFKQCGIFADNIALDNCTATHCLFYCSGKLHLGAGSFNSQFMAGDSIIIAPGARFGKMALIINMRDSIAKKGVTGGIYVAPGATVMGTLMSVLNPKIKNKSLGPSMFIGKNSTIDGIIVTDQDIDVSAAKFLGHVWCRSVVTLNNNTAYTNFLFGTSLAPSLRTVAFPLCGELPATIVFE